MSDIDRVKLATALRFLNDYGDDEWDEDGARADWFQAPEADRFRFLAMADGLRTLYPALARPEQVVDDAAIRRAIGGTHGDYEWDYGLKAVELAVRQYGDEHDFRHDEDPGAATELLTEAQDVLGNLRAALAAPEQGGQKE